MPRLLRLCVEKSECAAEVAACFRVVTLVCFRVTPSRSFSMRFEKRARCRKQADYHLRLGIAPRTNCDDARHDRGHLWTAGSAAAKGVDRL